MSTKDSENSVLSVKNLKKSYGKRAALDNVSFTLDAGEFVVLLGPNGAGKTTLFNLLTGLFNPDEGEVMINGFDITKHPIKSLEHLGIVFQQPTLDLDLSVYQNLKFHAALHGIPSNVAHDYIIKETEPLDLGSRLQEKVRKLNGGHRRRVELVRALMHQPSLILLDEPTVGLDISTRQFILEHIHQLSQQRKVTVLWASHLIDETQVADRIIIQHQGKIVFDGTNDELLNQTKRSSAKEAFQQLTQSTPN